MNSNNNNFIGIFDSGFGGISVLNSLIRLMPREKYVYFADSTNFPYGKKSKKELVGIGNNIIEKFTIRGAKIVVIACNTMSTSDMGAFTTNFPDTKIIGTLPSFIPIFTPGLVLSENNISYDKENGLKRTVNAKKLLVIATTATCKSKYLTELVKDARGIIDIYVEPADFIARAVEDNTLETFEFNHRLCTFFKEYMDIDFLLLGCTHFPFALKAIKEILGEHTHILSSGDVTADECYKYLSSNNLISNSQNLSIEIIDENIDDDKKKIYERLIHANSSSLKLHYSNRFN